MAEPLTTAALIALGTQAAEALNRIIKRLPTKDQKALEKFYEFVDIINEEETRADSDFDDILAWNERKRLLFKTTISKITRPSGK